MNRFTALLVGTISLSGVAEEVDPFEAELELGVLATSGNTETSSFKGAANIRQDLRRWKNQFVVEGLFNQNEVEQEDENGDIIRERQTIGQRYFLSAQSDFKLKAEHRGLFVFGSYENDRFSGFDFQSTVAIGYSDRLIETERSTFDYSVGPGASIFRNEDVVADGVLIEGEETTIGVVRVAFEYIFKISETAKFTQTLASDLSTDTEENSRTRAESALSANINSSMAMKFSYLINQNTHVPAGKKHADTQAAVTLVFSF